MRLHLDGTEEHPPAHGAPITLEGKEVGLVGTAVQHYDDGQIALALLRRGAAQAGDEARFAVGGQAASL